jgi:hypothetical protein
MAKLLLFFFCGGGILFFIAQIFSIIFPAETPPTEEFVRIQDQSREKITDMVGTGTSILAVAFDKLDIAEDLMQDKKIQKLIPKDTLDRVQDISDRARGIGAHLQGIFDQIEDAATEARFERHTRARRSTRRTGTDNEGEVIEAEIIENHTPSRPTLGCTEE